MNPLTTHSFFRSQCLNLNIGKTLRLSTTNNNNDIHYHVGTETQALQQCCSSAHIEQCSMSHEPANRSVWNVCNPIH